MSLVAVDPLQTGLVIRSLGWNRSSGNLLAPRGKLVRFAHFVVLLMIVCCFFMLC